MYVSENSPHYFSSIVVLRAYHVYFVGYSWYHRYNCVESAQSEHKANPNDESITTAA